MINPLDVLKCNCARCACELIGSKMRGLTLPWTCDGQPFVAGFINQRPYCRPCLERMEAEDYEQVRRMRARYAVAGGLSGPDEDETPWEQNGVRALEDACGEA